MGQYSLTAFVQATAQDDTEADAFELENPYVLELNLHGRVWTKAGAMIDILAT
jgi:hypothetical protein